MSAEIDLTDPADVGPVVSGAADFDLGMRMLAGQQEDEALDRFEIAIATAAEPAVRTSAAAHVAALLLGFGRPWEVATFTAIVRERNRSLADYLDAAACIQLDDPLGALEYVGASGPPAAWDDTWFPCPPGAVRAVRARALAACGRIDDATVELSVAIDETPGAAQVWESIAAIANVEARFELAAFVERLPESALVAVFGWLHGAPRRGVDRVAEACFERFGPHPALLAAVSAFAPHLHVERALDWTARIAEAGGTANPVLDRAETAGVARAERVLAAAAGAVLDEPRGRAALEIAAYDLADEEIAPLASEVLALNRDVADSYVVAVATTTPRCLALATVLCDHGFTEPALAVLVHGLTLPQADELLPEQFALLVPLRTRGMLAAFAEAAGDDEVAAILRSVTDE